MNLINIYRCSTTFVHLGPAQRRTKGEKTIGRQDAEENRHGLLEADRARDRRSSQNRRSKKTQLNAVRLAVGDAISAEAILEDTSVCEHAKVCAELGSWGITYTRSRPRIQLQLREQSQF